MPTTTPTTKNKKAPASPAPPSPPPPPPVLVLTPADRDAILAAARAGESFASIARRYDISREYVRQIIRRLDPNFTMPRSPQAVRARKKAAREQLEARRRDQLPCPIDGKKVRAPRTRYCSAKCASVARLFREVTDYRGARQRSIARHVLRHSDDLSEKKYALRVLGGKAGKKRWLLEGSETHKRLQKAGLLDKLPEGFQIVSRRAG